MIYGRLQYWGFSLNVFLVLRKTYSSEYFYFFIVVLKFEEPQFHASNVGNVRTVLNYFALKGVPELVELRKDSYSISEDPVKKKEVTRQKSRNLG